MIGFRLILSLLGRLRFHDGVSTDSIPMVSLEYPWPETPPPGETIPVAPGIHWLSMPLPFQLDHINLWLLEDADESGSGAAAGWTVVDTGIGDRKTRDLWERLFAKFHPVRRVIVTHYHP